MAFDSIKRHAKRSVDMVLGCLVVALTISYATVLPFEVQLLFLAAGLRLVIVSVDKWGAYVAARKHRRSQHG